MSDLTIFKQLLAQLSKMKVIEQLKTRKGIELLKYCMSKSTVQHLEILSTKLLAEGYIVSKCTIFAKVFCNACRELPTYGLEKLVCFASASSL